MTWIEAPCDPCLLGHCWHIERRASCRNFGSPNYIRKCCRCHKEAE